MGQPTAFYGFKDRLRATRKLNSCGEADACHQSQIDSLLNDRIIALDAEHMKRGADVIRVKGEDSRRSIQRVQFWLIFTPQSLTVVAGTCSTRDKPHLHVAV
jgi:hypothetical protein